MKKQWRCSVCGHIVDEECDKCPNCHSPWSKFEEIEADSLVEWACEHKIPEIDHSKVDPIILEKIRGCFTAETTEVAMYKAAARQAFRQGYPEIGLTMDEVANQEAGHAARFAEILGEKVSTSTEENLKNFINGEKGACQVRLEIATWAKQNGFDALHDSVHDISKDEARHGQSFEGLLNRYFKK